jgi:hypothetical protein
VTKWKPKSPYTEWQRVSQKHYTQPCDHCGGVPSGMRAAITTQTSWMRGDDEVEFLCITCAIARGIRPTGAVALLLFDAMTDEERLIVSDRLRK